MKIICLHTLGSNVEVFDAFKPEGVEVEHVVKADLLADAERAGSLTPEIKARAVAQLLELSQQADAVLLTCSTVGPAADEARLTAKVPVLRADASLAAESVSRGDKVLVLCAVETTVEPSRKLFEAAAEKTGATIELRVVPDAWAAFKAGDLTTYYRLVADYADAAFRAGYKVIALAQASMGGAVALAKEGRLLASPEISMAAVFGAAESATA